MPERPKRRRKKPPPGRYSELRRDLVGYLFWLFTRAPEWVSRAHVSALTTLARGGRFVPGNPVVDSLESVARLASEEDGRQGPAANYRDFVRQVRRAGYGYIDLLRRGPAAVDAAVQVPDEVRDYVNRELAGGRGLVVATPHNVGGILASVAFGRTFPSRVLLRNSTSEARDRMVMDLFERLEVDAYLTRSASPAGMFRASLGALRKGKVLLLTLDNIDPGRRSRVEVSMFGQRVPFASWGARIALQAKAPLAPTWVTAEDGRFRIIVGEAIRDGDVQETIQHYATFFEQQILAHPSDWLFLGHKRWKRTLELAADA